MLGAGWRLAAGQLCCKALPGPGVESLYERAFPPVPWNQILRISCPIRSNLLKKSDINLSRRCAKLPGIFICTGVNYLGTVTPFQKIESSKRFFGFRVGIGNIPPPHIPSWADSLPSVSISSFVCFLLEGGWRVEANSRTVLSYLLMFYGRFWESLPTYRTVSDGWTLLRSPLLREVTRWASRSVRSLENRQRDTSSGNIRDIQRLTTTHFSLNFGYPQRDSHVVR